MAENASQKPPTKIEIYLSHPWKLIQTIFLFFTWIVLGIHTELIAPTLPTLAENVNVHYSGMGSVLALRGAGFLVANILGAFLQNIVRKYSNAVLMCGFILPIIVLFATPFVTSIMLLCFLSFLHGIGHGLTDLSGTNTILSMWSDYAAAPMNLVRLGYPLGAMFVNLLVRPFLTKNMSPVALSSNTIVETKPNILVPYSITGGLCVLIVFGHLLFFIRMLKNERSKLEDYAVVSTNSENVNHLAEKSRHLFPCKSILSVLFIFSILFQYGNEQTFGKFFFTYLKFDHFNISSEGANWGTILYWLSYSMGRFTLAFVSIFISTVTCLNIAWFGTLCLGIAWLVFVWIIGLSATSLFILGAMTGFIFGPIIPLTLAFYNQRINVVPVLLALVLAGSALGMMIFPKLGGVVLDHNPNHFPTLYFTCMLMSILLYIVSNVVYFLHQHKTTKTTKLSPKNIVEEEHQEMTN